MTTLTITGQLASEILAIAEQEQRPVEDVLAMLVKKYAPVSLEEMEARLRAMKGITPPSGEDIEPPFTEEEERELADLLGAAGPISEIIIEERRQGY